MHNAPIGRHPGLALRCRSSFSCSSRHDLRQRKAPASNNGWPLECILTSHAGHTGGRADLQRTHSGRQKGPGLALTEARGSPSTGTARGQDRGLRKAEHRTKGLRPSAGRAEAARRDAICKLQQTMACKTLCTPGLAPGAALADCAAGSSSWHHLAQSAHACYRCPCCSAVKSACTMRGAGETRMAATGRLFRIIFVCFAHSGHPWWHQGPWDSDGPVERWRGP